MVTETKLKTSFNLVRTDVDGVKNELAFALRRIAQMEATLNRIAIREAVKKTKKPAKKKKAKKKPVKKKKPAKKKAVKKKQVKKRPVKKKDVIWEEHLSKVVRRYPKLTLKEQLEIASRTWKKKKEAEKKKASKKKSVKKTSKKKK